MIAELLPWLSAMLVLIGASAFFSGCEAAFFSLGHRERNELSAGNRAQRAAGHLLEDPDRLLSAVLFANLVVNMMYFAIASIVSLNLERAPGGGHSVAAIFGIGSLLSIIFFSEMLPKSLAVLSAKRVAGIAALPLTLAVRVMDPIMPTLRLVNLLSRRLLWPGFQPEPYLEVSDLERAIDMSAPDAALAEQERMVLRNIVVLSDIQVTEWMRPRNRFQSFAPPVALADLDGLLPPSGYLLVSESDSEEPAAAIPLRHLCEVPQEHLERHARPVANVPWCATVADALQRMRHDRVEVVAVLNEYGETIGIITREDILDTICQAPTPAERLTKRPPINRVSESVWEVTGITSLRRLGRYFELELPEVRSVTVAGLLQELLQRLVREGDEVDFGPFHFRVLQPPDRGPLLVELTRRVDEEES